MLSFDNALLSVGLASLSFFLSYYMINRKTQTINSWIEENKGKIQRAHSIIGSQGGEAMKLKAGEKLLSQSLIQNSPVVDAVVSSGLLSPDMQDWIDTNPGLVIQLLPKMQAVLGQITQKSSKEEFNY